MGGGSDMQTIKGGGGGGGGGGVRKGKVREARFSGVPYLVAQSIYPY